MTDRGFNDTTEVAWSLLSYLALPAAAQQALIGPAGQWFAEEDANINSGANYLQGVARATRQYYVSFFESENLADDSALFDLRALLEVMIFSPDWRIWRASALEDPLWRLVRRIATAVLAEAGIGLNPPAKPFHIPDLIEVGVSEVRPLPDGLRPLR